MALDRSLIIYHKYNIYMRVCMCIKNDLSAYASTFLNVVILKGNLIIQLSIYKLIKWIAICTQIMSY